MIDGLYVIAPSGANELAHHGVKGMKWGVRRQRRSLSGNAHRALSKVYGLNERTYNALGNKTLASMNAAAKAEQLKKASAADKAKSTKKLAKMTTYQQKLATKAKNNAQKHSGKASELQNAYDDMSKNGVASKSWQNEVKKRAKDDGLAALSQRYSRRAMETHMVDVKLDREYHSRVSKQWMYNHKNVMNVPITEATTKRKLKKAYSRGRLQRINMGEG